MVVLVCVGEHRATRGNAYLAALPGSRPARDDAAMIAAFSITPLGTGESVGAAVADAVRVVRASGLPSETNAMFTNVEGEWDEVMDLIEVFLSSR